MYSKGSMRIHSSRYASEVYRYFDDSTSPTNVVERRTETSIKILFLMLYCNYNEIIYVCVTQ